MGKHFSHSAELLTAANTELGTTDWLEVTQERINLFADATGDHQWIHVDEAKAKDGPYGACIAHGYLTLALVNYFLPQLIEVSPVRMGVNYGCNKIRFPAVVKAGSRIRGHGVIVAVESLEGKAVQCTVRVTIEIEGHDKPACVADTISRYYF